MRMVVKMKNYYRLIAKLIFFAPSPCITGELHSLILMSTFCSGATYICTHQMMCSWLETVSDTGLGSDPALDFVGKRDSGIDFVGKRTPGMEFVGKRSPGMEFVGKRTPGMEFVGKRTPGTEFVGKRTPGMEFVGKRTPGMEFVGKRTSGMEFVGKRAPGMEFVGKRTPGMAFVDKSFDIEFLGPLLLPLHINRAPPIGMEFLGKRSYPVSSTSRNSLKSNGILGSLKREGLKPNGIFGPLKRSIINKNGFYGAHEEDEDYQDDPDYDLFYVFLKEKDGKDETQKLHMKEDHF